MFQLRRLLLRGTTVRKMTCACALVILCVAASPVVAIEIKELQVSENGGVYYINMVTVIDAPAEYVYRVLTDYVHIHRLNPSITQSDILPSPESGVVRVRTRILDCIFIFCMELDRVEDCHEAPPHVVHTEIVPSLSDFRSGTADWHIEEMNQRSRVVYEAHMEPGFLIIPIIGIPVVEEKLRQEMEITLRRIECVAKIEEKLDWNPHLRPAMVDVDALCGQM
jgi:hypothetical protein